MNSKILIVDDNKDILLALKLLFKPLVKNVITESDPKNIPILLSENIFDAILLDMNFTLDMTSGNEGLFWLKEILKIDENAIVILITAYGDVETAVKAVKMGATDFILKPWQNEKLIATLTSALRLRESKIELEKLRSQNYQLNNDLESQFPNLIGKSKGMQKVLRTIKKVAETEANVLILGENGTGKGLVAREIHKNSKRSKEIFMSVDLGAISKNLFESELFGYVKGAFTDARENRTGRFELANKGTLFLDEIGNLEFEMQSKLLSAIEKQEITRVGSGISNKIDIRLVCATNKSIDELSNDNYFRQDLLFRINTVVINIPPLRERTDDIPLLVKFFFEQLTKKYNKNNLSISESAVKKLQSYNWPGNIRELQHSLERGIILSENSKLLPDDFILENPNKNNNKQTLAEIEENVIINTLKKHNGNISYAAKELGLTRTSLYRRLEKFKIEKNSLDE